MALRLFRLRVEERTPIWRVYANIFNFSRGQPTRGGPPTFGRGANNSSPWERIVLRNINEGFGPGLILWYDLSNGQVNSGFWWGNPKERDNSEDADVDGRIILRLTFRKWDVGV